MLRSSHSPESFRLEVATLCGGKHPRAEGATPEDVGRGMRELALSGKPHTSLAGFVYQITKRRRETERGQRAKAEERATAQRKREENQRPRERASMTTMAEEMAKLSRQMGVVPDKGAA